MPKVVNNIYALHCLAPVEQILPWDIIYNNKVSENNAFEYWASFIPDTNLVAGMQKLFLNLFYILIQKHFQIKHPSDVL